MKNIENYRGKKGYVVYCKNSDEWKYMCKLCNFEPIMYDKYFPCLKLEYQRAIMSINYAKNNNYTILEAKDFMEEEIKYTLEYCKANKIAVEVPSVEIGEQIAKLVPGKHELGWEKFAVGGKYKFRFDENGYSLFINSDTFFKDYGRNYIIISAEQFIKDNTQQMKKPKYFVIKRDANNPLWEDYIQWLNDTYNSNFIGHNDEYYGHDGGTYRGNCHSSTILSHFKNNPTVLTLEQWYKLFIENNQTMQKLTVKKSEFKKVHDVACDTWKKKCKEYASKDLFSDEITFTQQEVDEMFDAAQSHQLPVLEEVFGKRDELMCASLLKQGEIMKVIHNNDNGTAYIIKAYFSQLRYDSNMNFITTATGDCTSHKGKKLPKGTKIEIIAG